MIDRGIAEFDRIDITSIASDGTRRWSTATTQ